VLFTGMIVNQVFFWCTNQTIIQRVLGARNLKEAKKGVLIAASFKLLGPRPIVLPGVIAYHMFKDTLGSDDYLQAYPMPVKTVLPTALTGFFAAVMVGAVLSTFNSVLNSAATLFSTGIYKTVINPASTGRNQVRVGRLCSAILAISAMLIAPTIDTSGSLYVYLQQINATFFGPMLAVMLCGLLTRRISATAVKAGLLVGPVIFYLLNFSLADPFQALMKRLFGLSENMHFLHTLAIVFVLTLLMMYLLSLKSGPVATSSAITIEKPVLDMKHWRWAKPAAIILSSLTLLFYVFLAQ